MNENIIKLYKNNIFFPMIGAVLEGRAQGFILSNCNRAVTPTHFFVVNKFGFCQELYYEWDNIFFEKSICPFIENKNRMKLRLYNPCGKLRKYIDGLDFANQAKRGHYCFGGSIPNCNIDLKDNFIIQKMDLSNYEDVFNLNLSKRYYEDESDFCNNAMPFIAKKGKRIVGIIYSAAYSKKKSEIDIFVAEEYRKQNIAKALINRYLIECVKKHVEANWDCYINNYASVAVANKCGFNLIQQYNYYNIENYEKLY